MCNCTIRDPAQLLAVITACAAEESSDMEVDAGGEGQVLADSCFQVIHADACRVLQCWG